MSPSTACGLILAAALAAPASAQAAPADPVAADLYRQIRTGDGNRIFSPAGLSDAFALAYPGAGAQTAVEMQRVFGFRAAGAAPRFSTNRGADGPELSSANALWVAEGLRLRPDYLALVRAAYGAAVETADFARHADAEQARINRWVETATHDRIKNLLVGNTPNAETRLMLTNAVYLKARWEDPFSAEATHPDAFHAPGGHAVPVRMMRQTTSQRTMKGPGFRAVELPYAGSDLAMVILLPDARNGLRALEAAMTPPVLAAWLGRLDARDRDEIDLSLPRFSIENRRSLADDLRALGLRQAFSGKANFSNLASEPLRIDAVVHQAFIKVDEDGTEATATTALELVTTSTRRGPPPVVVRADHPFVFLIRDKTSGAILFMGRLQAPEPA